MESLECKKCGGQLQGPDANSVYTCEWCGAKYRDPFGAIYSDSTKWMKDTFRELSEFISSIFKDVAKLMALPTGLLLIFLLIALVPCCLIAFLVYKIIS